MTWTAEYRESERDYLVSAGDDSPLMVIRPRAHRGDAGKREAADLAARLVVALSDGTLDPIEMGGEEMHPVEGDMAGGGWP